VPLSLSWLPQMLTFTDVLSVVFRYDIIDEAFFCISNQRLDEALLLQSQIANLDRPSSRVLTAFRNWFNGKNRYPKSRGESPILTGRAKSMLDDEKDLAALRPPTDKDALSRFLQDHWPFQVTYPLPDSIPT